MEEEKIIAAILTLAASNGAGDSKRVLETYSHFVKALSRRDESVESGSGQDYRIIDMTSRAE